MTLRWFFSQRVRRLNDMRKHVQKLLDNQRDLLSPQAITAITAVLAETTAVLQSNADKETLKKQGEQLEASASKWLRPYPHSEWRENIEVFLVAIAVAMAIRTFFLQPFKIPTGSMEPTLYGIETEDLRDKTNFAIPSTMKRIWGAVGEGTIYHEFIAPEDGEVVRLGPLEHRFIFINKQIIWVRYRGQDQDVPITIWCGPDERLEHAAGLDHKAYFNKGEPIVRFMETTGDHLFVDRFSYNFRHPTRGDIVVFMTQGIAKIQHQDQFYIKRLVGLPGESVSIGEDQHVRINGKRLDATTPHFENLYGFDPAQPHLEGRTGHYNGHTLQLSPESYLRSSSDSIEVPLHHFLVFGDNTLDSFDSRYWGPLAEQNVIGKAFFVYWPISLRFGCGQR